MYKDSVNSVGRRSEEWQANASQVRGLCGGGSRVSRLASRAHCTGDEMSTDREPVTGDRKPPQAITRATKSFGQLVVITIAVARQVESSSSTYRGRCTMVPTRDSERLLDRVELGDNKVIECQHT